MLEGVREHIASLIAAYEAAKQRNAELESKLEESENALAACKKQITELNRQIDNLRLTSAFTGSGNTQEAKDRINKLVKEIDKCIKLLQK